eukprot:CAMPEP_0198321946 /NCGR_PEP_ID=MMETSP1450-20131203/10556_1 /TAXON_ID=753684 ORGANISM="Madagascaria erythrocladiodes, Strain CCMP3234" /NCGR_SAMPLE_ID=MMETSP1450 /ASSEMBLY_ACC=CAM_ASM_001115 /LENGTH=97 /DNA_ID=CAMNT_0044025531 /DNA_START=56 /DNA_END=346 /DNA_ORIENTATION=+
MATDAALDDVASALRRLVDAVTPSDDVVVTPCGGAANATFHAVVNGGGDGEQHYSVRRVRDGRDAHLVAATVAASAAGVTPRVVAHDEHFVVQRWVR